MAVLTKVGSFNLSTDAVGTTQTITGVGFQPKLVILWGSGRTGTTDAAGVETIRQFFGASNGTEQFVLATRINNGAATTSSARAQDPGDTAMVHSDDALTTTPTDHRVSSFNSDGFVVTVTQQTTSRAARVHYLAIGGDEILNTKIGAFELLTGTGSQSVTGVGFQPDFVLLAHLGLQDTVAQVTQPTSLISIGMAGSVGGQGVVQSESRSGQAASTGLSYHNDAEIWAHTNNTVAGNVGGRASFTSFDLDGFTLNRIDSMGADIGTFYIAIRGGNHRVGSLTTRTDSNPIVTSGLGIQVPKAVMFLSAVRAESALDTSTVNATLSIGAATSATERVASVTKDVFGQDPTVTATAQEHDAVYINLDNSGAVAALMDFSSFGSDSFTTVMDDPEATTGMVLYWAIGEDSAPTGPTISSAGSWVDSVEFTVSGTNFGANTGSASLTVGGVAQTQITSWTDTNITGIATQGNHPFGTNRSVVVTNSTGTPSAGVNVQWQVPVNHTYVAITDTSQPDEWRFTPTPDLAVGDQIHARNFSGISVSDFQLLTNGTWIANSIFIASFEARVWDSADSTWSEWALQTVLLSTDPPPDPTPGTGIIRTKAIDCLVVE